MRRPSALSFRPSVVRLRWLGLAAAAVGLASLAFAQAAAGVGLRIRWFAPLGPSFFAWQPEYRSFEEQLIRPASVAPDPGRLRAAERRILTVEPLSNSALRLMAWSDARSGREAEALTRIRVIDRLTRRDPIVQLWLLEDAVRRDDVAGVLHRYDVLLRTQAELHDALLAELSGLLGSDQVRAELGSYADARNPWFPDLLRTMSRTGHAGDAAAILIGLPALPDTASYRTAYADVVAALAKEESIPALRNLHARLPGAGSQTDPEFTEADLSRGYAPFRWAMAAGAERMAQLQTDRPGRPMLMVRAAPLSRGEAASRLILLPERPVTLSWTVDADAQGATGGSAHWAIRCNDDGRLTLSGEILGGRARSRTQAMPYPCTAVRIQLVVEGGTGAEGTTFAVSRLRLLPGEPSGVAAASGVSSLAPLR